MPHFDSNMEIDVDTNFIALNLLLQFCHQYAKNQSVSNIIRSVFTINGLCFCFSQIEKF